MMSNVPNSYGLPTVGPARRPTEGSGHAERADFEGENQIRLTNATYSTCKPGEVDWYLKGSKIHLDYDEDVGEATHASVWFKDVPIFYSPLASFSLNHERKSGFMHPFFSTSTKNGFDFTIPFYWNIAPNYDAMLYTRHMNDRGFQFGTEAQYKGYNYLGASKLEFMPNDELLNRQRYAYNFQHQHNLGRGVSAVVNWQGVSDDNYWQDMSRLLQTSPFSYPSKLALGTRHRLAADHYAGFALSDLADRPGQSGGAALFS
jgi:LPS-assembly protein